jgi:hypothetical protein
MREGGHRPCQVAAERPRTTVARIVNGWMAEVFQAEYGRRPNEMKGGMALPGDEPSRLSALPRWIDAIGVPPSSRRRVRLRLWSSPHVLGFVSLQGVRCVALCRLTDTAKSEGIQGATPLVSLVSL